MAWLTKLIGRYTYISIKVVSYYILCNMKRGDDDDTIYNDFIYFVTKILLLC